MDDLDKSIDAILDLMGVPERNRLNDRIAALEAQLADARGLLRRCTQGAFCPVCGVMKPTKCAADCRLAALLNYPLSQI
jgi:hypothetical protein